MSGGPECESGSQERLGPEEREHPGAVGGECEVQGKVPERRVW